MLTTESKVESFLEEYKRSRVIVESTVNAILSRTLSFEKKFNKAFYEFTKEEALEMFTESHAISNRSLQNANLILKHFALWFEDFRGAKTANIYTEITKEDLDRCVDKEKKRSLILSKDDLDEVIGQLINKTDAGILLLLFLGAGSNWLRELTYLNMDQVSLTDGMIYFKTGKKIPINYDQYEIIRLACEETELLSYGTTARVSAVRSHGIYKERFNVRVDSSDQNNPAALERRFRFVQRRLALVSRDLNIKLTSSGLQDGGLLYNLKMGMKRNNMTFEEYIKTEEAGILAKRYDVYSHLYAQILRDKFGNYF